MRILFYAINHVGLGHVARLSVVQRYISERRLAECYFFSESRHAAEFFTCPGVLLKGEHLGAKQRWRLLEAGVQRALREVQPDVLVCDTYWSEAVSSLPEFRSRGGRAILMLRMTDSRLMRLRLNEAEALFDTILLPHHPYELRWSYRDDPKLLQALDSPQVVPVGPVCRATRPSAKKEVIFSIGAGGEWPGATKADTVATFLRAFTGASRLLTASGHPKPTLAAGAFLQVNAELRKRYVIRRTNSVHEHYGPQTTVVTRGGYNTTWEAIAAGSPMVVCGTRNRLDDVKARSVFLQREGLGRSVTPDSREIFEAIATPWERHGEAVQRWAPIVNAGLSVVADEILGGAFLRAQEPQRRYAASTMGARDGRLIARFEDVNAGRPSAAVRSAARLATELGYDVSCADASQKDKNIVNVLIWPGPRVRNELRISEELAERQKRGVNTGLGIHADLMPRFLVEYLLRAFALYNRRG